MQDTGLHNMDAATLLAWHIAMGADEAIDDECVDRFTAPAPQAATVQQPPTQQSGASPRVQQSRPGVQMQAGTGPRRVEARPVQAIAGAGQAAAESVVASCKTLDELEAALNAFDGGLLKRSAKNTVFADGTRGAPLMIVGEAPGADEDQQGKPFVGVSGQLLDKMLNASGMSRDKDVYISNVVPWRPLGNRTPDQAVITMCLPFIRKHIELAAPKAVLMLGGVSAKALLGTEDGITRLRGRWREIDIRGQKFAALPAYHPAYLLRQPALKGLAWRDLLAVKRKLQSS
ncbi:uracil-DNA glycosylase [Kordiimonas gwangyangensis]|uniref:uracil-DNA glycosylase n=2 Tax=Kordiimonas gwangyangensis TaxID=288022 RepID=UPI000371A489|nr:uracil-DNA glycosylase [Kordiimonas gwangyangensis]